MAVKIRLQRKGRKKAPFYHIVIADARSPRDGRFIEKIGIYNPITKPATIEIDREKAFEWLMKGAQPTDTTRAILRYKGILYRKHLSRGVQKGALTQEKADQMYQDWISGKEGTIAEKVAARQQEVSDFHKKLSGEAKAAPAPPPVVASTEEE
ncbi:MAG TPA: 30S ribosomal protein S16 [Saprospiraceae bacterium]|nr:30S ribosomal protein S16 [Saprospiraceae bacterium]